MSSVGTIVSTVRSIATQRPALQSVQARTLTRTLRPLEDGKDRAFDSPVDIASAFPKLRLGWLTCRYGAVPCAEANTLQRAVLAMHSGISEALLECFRAAYALMRGCRRFRQRHVSSETNPAGNVPRLTSARRSTLQGP